MAEALKIEIFRKKLPDELTKALSEADSRTDIGSGAALSAATAAAWLIRAAALTAEERGSTEQLDYLCRNGEILRSYMIRLSDEDVESRGPLRKAWEEGDPRTVEAARQPAAAIANEIINMMNQLLDLLNQLAEICSGEAKRFVAASADLAMGSVRASMRYVLDLGAKCSDETYRYIVKRENEITLDACRQNYAKILEKVE